MGRPSQHQTVYVPLIHGKINCGVDAEPCWQSLESTEIKFEVVEDRAMTPQEVEDVARILATWAIRDLENKSEKKKAATAERSAPGT